MLLLDEVTVDMDVVGRLDLLAFFEEECAARGASILYATHIFDGLARWATHLALVEDGRLVRGVRMGPAGACALSPAPAWTGWICPHASPASCAACWHAVYRQALGVQVYIHCSCCCSCASQ